MVSSNVYTNKDDYKNGGYSAKNGLTSNVSSTCGDKNARLNQKKFLAKNKYNFFNF